MDGDDDGGAVVAAVGVSQRNADDAVHAEGAVRSHGLPAQGQHGLAQQAREKGALSSHCHGDWQLN